MRSLETVDRPALRALPAAAARARQGRRIRVCHLIASMGMGGAQRVLLDTARMVDRSRFETFVGYTFGGFFEPHLRALDVELCPFPSPPRHLGIPSFFAQALALLRRTRPDIVHLHLGAEVWGLPATRLLGLRSVYNEQAARPRRLLGGRTDFTDPYEQVRPYLCRMVTRVVAASEAVRTTLIEEFGFRPERVVTLYNSVHAPADCPPPRASDGAEVVVGAYGRHHPVKGFDVLLEALALAARRPEGAGLRLLLGGDGTLRPALERQAERLGLGERVRFVGRVQATDFLQTVDVLCVPSRYETFGLVAAEGMAAGRPVIASDVGGLTEVVSHDESGLLVPMGEPAPLCEALLRLAGNRAAREAMGRAAWRRAHDRFSLVRYRDGIEALYEAVCAS